MKNTDLGAVTLNNYPVDNKGLEKNCFPLKFNTGIHVPCIIIQKLKMKKEQVIFSFFLLNKLKSKLQQAFFK